MNNKPLILRIEDAKRDLISAVSTVSREYDLPAYFLEPIIADIHNQLIRERNEEVKTLRLKYAEDVKKDDVPSEKAEAT